MKKEFKYEALTHYTMSVCGGFFGAYAILNRSEIFGSSQTANLISIVCGLIGTDFSQVIIRMGALFIYIASMILAVFLSKKTTWNLKYLSIGLNLLVAITIGFLPSSMNPVIALYPIFFITAFQWSVFKGSYGYVSSTIFSTNNLKQTVTSLTEYILSEDRKSEESQKLLVKFRFFACTLAGFHIGVVLGYMGYRIMALHSSWLCIFPLLFALLLIASEDEALLHRFTFSKRQEKEGCC